MLKRLLPGLKSTSSMTAGDIKALKIRYLGINDISVMFPEAGSHQRNVAPGVSYDHLHLRNIQAKDIRLQRVMISENASVGTIDSKTYDLVADILTSMGLNTFPLSTNREPAYRYDIGLGKAFISAPSYVVEKGRVALVIDEDRHLGCVNRINQWGEHQLAS
ncbi:hypothetical protein BGZ76_007394 [Entomortierella beljakovae]|nr:hypothetical protein BGZ76_007394 [Entomortierella beljakovae]